MAKLKRINMLFSDIKYTAPDYKVALTEDDNAANLSDFLWNKLSDRNKIVLDETGKNINEELNTNKNLIPCKLENNKIVLSPDNTEGGGSTENNIIVDAFHLVDSNTDNFIFLQNVKQPVCFPVQLATGKINNIMIVNGEGGGMPPTDIFIAIYGNYKPGLTGARLLWESVGHNKTISDEGLISFNEEDKPIIKGYFEDENTTKAINFFYIVFTGLSTDTSGGYRIFGKNVTGENYQLISKIGSVHNVGQLAPNEFVNGDHFHTIFDYELDTTINNIIIPYISFTMTV